MYHGKRSVSLMVVPGATIVFKNCARQNLVFLFLFSKMYSKPYRRHRFHPFYRKDQLLQSLLHALLIPPCTAVL